MSDLISRQAAVDTLNLQAEAMQECSERYAEQRKGVLSAVNLIEDLPSAEPERKTGRWEFIGDQMFRCSECGHTFTQKFLEGWRESLDEPLFPPHCPSCGSYNVGEQE